MSTIDLVASVVASDWVPCWLKLTPGGFGNQWLSKVGLKVDRCCCCVSCGLEAVLRATERVTEGLCDLRVLGNLVGLM